MRPGHLSVIRKAGSGLRAGRRINMCQAGHWRERIRLPSRRRDPIGLAGLRVWEGPASRTRRGGDSRLFCHDRKASKPTAAPSRNLTMSFPFLCLAGLAALRLRVEMLAERPTGAGVRRCGARSRKDCSPDPAWCKTSTDREIEQSRSKEGLRGHLEETHGHVERLEEVFRLLGEEPKGTTCPAIDRIIKEANDLAGDIAA